MLGGDHLRPSSEPREITLSFLFRYRAQRKSRIKGRPSARSQFNKRSFASVKVLLDSPLSRVRLRITDFFPLSHNLFIPIWAPVHLHVDALVTQLCALAAHRWYLLIVDVCSYQLDFRKLWKDRLYTNYFRGGSRHN